MSLAGDTAPVLFPVISVLSGRRNNRPEEGIRPLCVYGPIHYQELPELFFDVYVVDPAYKPVGATPASHLLRSRPLYALKFEGKRYDAGDTGRQA